MKVKKKRQGSYKLGRSLGRYLETGDHLDEYLVGADVLKKRAEVADVVTAEGFKSCCFTKSYGRYVEGTGEEVTYFI